MEALLNEISVRGSDVEANTARKGTRRRSPTTSRAAESPFWLLIGFVRDLRRVSAMCGTTSPLRRIRTFHLGNRTRNGDSLLMRESQVESNRWGRSEAEEHRRLGKTSPIPVRPD